MVRTVSLIVLLMTTAMGTGMYITHTNLSMMQQHQIYEMRSTNYHQSVRTDECADAAAAWWTAVYEIGRERAKYTSTCTPGHYHFTGDPLISTNVQADILDAWQNSMLGFAADAYADAVVGTECPGKATDLEQPNTWPPATWTERPDFYYTPYEVQGQNPLVEDDDYRAAYQGGQKGLNRGYQECAQSCTINSCFQTCLDQFNNAVNPVMGWLKESIEAEDTVPGVPNWTYPYGPPPAHYDSFPFSPPSLFKRLNPFIPGSSTYDMDPYDPLSHPATSFVDNSDEFSIFTLASPVYSWEECPPEEERPAP